MFGLQIQDQEVRRHNVSPLNAVLLHMQETLLVRDVSHC